MKHMRNPVTGEVVYTTALGAKRLARYGWEYVKREQWVDYKRAIIQASIARNVNAAKPKLGLVQ